MNSKHSKVVRKSNPSIITANLVLASLVLGIPLVTKLILETARAASSQPMVATQPMAVPRHAHTATVLADGRVLMAGGANTTGAVASAEIYDPATKSFQATPEMKTARAGHSATLLTNGRVLIAGGQNAAGPESSAEIFDPATGNFRPVGFMTSPRSGQSATVLADGRVLIAGGDQGGTAELFDPAAETFSALPYPLKEPRSGHSATLFSDDSVLLAGGSATAQNSLEWLSPADFSFSLSPYPLATPHSGHSAIPTIDGKLLIFGGNTQGTVEEFDPATFTVRTIATLNSPDSTAIGLANGKTLVLWPGDAGLFTPGMNTFEPLAGGQLLQRAGATATGLPTDNNRILVAGGINSSNELIGAAALFNPARLETDYDDYSPGTFVLVWGFGFKPGETIAIHMTDTVGDVYDWTIGADGNGNFVEDPLFGVQEQHISATFDLIATGTVSGLQAKAQFSDSGSVTTLANATISADTAASVNGPFTPLTGPVLDELLYRDIGTGTIILSAPSGFQFDTSSPVTVTVTRLAGTDALVTLQNTTVTPTASAITINITARDGNTSGLANTRSQLTWSGIKVRPTAGTPLASGRLYMNSSSGASVAGITKGSSGSSFGQLTEVAGAAKKLAFVPQPANTAAGATMSSFAVQVQDQFGNAVAQSGVSITLTLNGSTLYSGTNPRLTDATGKATFNDFVIRQAGSSLNFTSANDAGLLNATSGNFAVTASTQTTVGTSLNPSTYGQSVTFTATVNTVAPAVGTPTGTVTFKDGTTTIGTATLSSGQATLTTASLNAGARSITAVYTATPGFGGSTSPAITQTVNKADTATTLVSSLNPACSGQSVIFTATATAVAPGVTPTGTVTFKDGVTTLGTGTLNASGKATYTIASLSAGSHSITATYGGSSSFNTSVSSILTQTVNPSPSATITADSSVCPGSTGNPASVPDAGAGASYAWTISGGTITSGSGTRSITYTAGPSGSVQLNVTVTNALGCPTSSSKSVTIATPSASLQDWSTLPMPPHWYSSTLSPGTHDYSEGESIPFRLQLGCAPATWTITIEYDFKDGNTPRHFTDFLTTYNSSEATVTGHECDSQNCSSGPTTFPIPTDSSLTAGIQFPGNFTVYNGSITNVSAYTLVQGSTDSKRLTISGTSDGPGKNVLILFAGHLARENEWGAGYGASSFSGASAKVSYDSAVLGSGQLSINPGGIIKQADLKISMTDSPDPLCAGGALTYTLTVTNKGPNQVASVTVTDPLPAGTTFISATKSQGTVTSSGSTVTFALGTINAGATATMTLTVNVSGGSSGTLTNTATVSASQSDPADPNLADNSASTTTTIKPLPTCSIIGPTSICPSSTVLYNGPDGVASYAWSISGNGTLSAPTNAKSVNVNAGSGSSSLTLTLVTTTTNGCTRTCQITVSVTPAAPPSITCPNDRQLQWGDPTDTNHTGIAIANVSSCTGSSTVTYFDTPIAANCTGHAGIKRTWVATSDTDSTKTASCEQFITYLDATVPVISLLGDAEVTVECHGSYTDAGATATDTGAGDLTAAIVTVNPVNVNAPGTYSVTYNVSDPCGNGAVQVSRTVRVVDSTSPLVVSCPADAVGECPATPEFGTPVFSDACDDSLLVNSVDEPLPVSGKEVSKTKRTWTATDHNGNNISCSQTISVLDTTNPTVTSCPLDATIECPATLDFGIPVFSDTCDASLSVEFADESLPVSAEEVRKTKRTWTATDHNGNSVSCSQTITVRDTTSPTVTSCPTDATIECPATPEFGTPVFSDTCDASLLVEFADESLPVSGEEVSKTKRTWTATDHNRNSVSCSQTITVRDTANPTVTTCPADATIECPATPQFGTPVFSDGCDNNLSVSSADESLPVSGKEVSKTKRTWTATDHKGNSITCSQTITVRDTTNPTVTTCPADATIECPATPEFGTPVFSDTCDDSLSVSSADESLSVSGKEVSKTKRTWTATDHKGNSVTCSQTITVRDTTNPTVTTCPADATIECPATPQFGTPVFSDICDNSLSVSSADESLPVSGKEVSKTKRTWTATDHNGNSVTCSQTITVRDTTNPTVTTCPADATIECPATPEFGTPVFSDSCDNSLSVSSADEPLPVSGKEVSKTKRTWTATDHNGNSVSCSRTITVRDTTNPTVTSCPSDATIECPATPEFGTPVFSDGCDNNLSVSSADASLPVSGKEVSKTKRTWTATDHNGNSVSCSQTITVSDTTAPTARCKDMIVSLDATGHASITAAQLDGGSTDLCGSVSLSLDKRTFDCSNRGNNLVTLTVRDNYGNQSTCTANVTVVDSTSPTALCKSIAVTVGLDGPVRVNAQDINNGSTDNCGVSSLAISKDGGVTFASSVTFDCTELGVRPVKLQVRDAAGNTSACDTTVTVNQRSTTLTYTGATSAPYGAPLTMSAMLKDSATGLGIAGRTVTFAFGSCQPMTATTDSTGLATATQTQTQTVGSYVVNVAFVGDCTFLSKSSQMTCPVVPQCVNPLLDKFYIGSTFSWTTSPSSSTATLTLSAGLKACFGYGDVRTARVTFAIRNADNSLTPIPSAQNLPVGLVDSGDITTGTATAITQWNIGSLDSDVLEIAIIVTGNYRNVDDPAQDGLVTVAKAPGANSILGCGLIANGTDSRGYLKGKDNDTTQFFLNVKYSKSGSNPQGKVTILVHSYNKPDGTPDTILHTYKVTSTAISVLAANTSLGKASFSSKAVIQDITNPNIKPISIDGGATLQVTMTDGDKGTMRTQGTGDTISFYLLNKKGGVWYANKLDANLRAVEGPLVPDSTGKYGDIVVK